MDRREFCRLVSISSAGALAASVGGRSVGAEKACPDLPKVRVHRHWRGLVTANDQPFIPFGTMYYRPGDGWTPRFWKNFDPEATHRDLLKLKALKLNMVRLWLTSSSFYRRPGVLAPAGVAKLDQFLSLAQDVGLYVQLCALTTWQGRPLSEIPPWQRGDIYADPQALEDQEEFWSLLATRYKSRNVILTYELANEPMINWNTPAMQAEWNKWNGRSTVIPPPKDDPGSAALLAFQHFREHIADQWTQRLTAAIKKADPAALVTVGLIQWSVPAMRNPLNLYSAFRPQRQAKFVDFMEIHCYPLADLLTYQSKAAEVVNLAYLESVLREAAAPGLPTVLSEFGWYGGGTGPNPGAAKNTFATQEQQATFCAREVLTSTPLACGWLNWAMYDTPQAADVSRLSGLFTADGKLKAWGRRFGEISQEYRRHLPPAPFGRIGPRPDLPWDQCLTSGAAAERFRMEYLDAFRRDEFRPESRG